MAGFSAADLIVKKRDGGALATDEIRWLIASHLAGEVPDYQLAAFLMAVYFRGLTAAETFALTDAMAHSGKVLDFSTIAPIVADKHSTGGVGDKTTLVVMPLVAHLGLPVAKLSGRGLGFTGGTRDKLESFPGFRTELGLNEMRQNLAQIGIVLAGQSSELAPADGLLYALRDVTGTVESIPLIASSVMSKKIAAGATVIALDVKAGAGAFMKTAAEAERLARLMIALGEQAGRRVAATVTNMEQPLGRAVGNVLEIDEAIATLRGDGPDDLRQLCVYLAVELLHAAGFGAEHELAQRVEHVLASGAALAKLGDLIEAQGGNRRDVEHPERLEHAPVAVPVPSPASGYVRALDAGAIGLLCARLGAGRLKKTDSIDHRVGVVLHAKIGDYVTYSQTLAVLHLARSEQADDAARALLAAYQISEQPVSAPPVILRHIRNGEPDINSA